MVTGCISIPTLVSDISSSDTQELTSRNKHTDIASLIRSHGSNVMLMVTTMSKLCPFLPRVTTHNMINYRLHINTRRKNHISRSISLQAKHITLMASQPLH